MAEFVIPCSWEMYGNMYITADTLKQAIEIAHTSKLPRDGNYIEGTFKIDEDIIEADYGPFDEQENKDERR